MKIAILLFVLKTLGPRHVDQAVEIANALIEESQAAQVSIDPLLITSIANQESGFNAHACNFDGRCVGLMQPRIGSSTTKTKKQLRDPRTNIREGIRILQEKIRMCGTLPKALAAYNQGSCNPRGKAGKAARGFARSVIKTYEHLQEEVLKIEIPAPYQFDTQGSEV